ncbi:MAG TPA: hypothetical protein VH062_08420 [Polyangiaceae bacterium]|jgi:hypothetical protein|nr:hypothetical protein [Polyangiaceae bacterium]
MRSVARVAPLALVLLGAARSLAADGDAAPSSAKPEPARAAPVAADRRFPFIAGALRLGLLPYGRGEEKNGCSGACMGFAPADASYRHGVAFGVGAEAFVTFLDVLRVGPSLFYVLPTHVDIDGAPGHFGVGSDLGIDLAVEAAPRIFTNLRVVPRLQGGATVLFPDGELSKSLSQLREYCPADASGCSGLSGAHVGWNIGAGVGALYFLTDRIRLRADLLVQYYSVHLYNISATLFANPIDVSETLSGARSFILLGAEY